MGASGGESLHLTRTFGLTDLSSKQAWTWVKQAWLTNLDGIDASVEAVPQRHKFQGMKDSSDTIPVLPRIERLEEAEVFLKT